MEKNVLKERRAKKVIEIKRRRKTERKRNIGEEKIKDVT